MGQVVDISPPVGLDLENDDCTLIAHAAIVRGNVVAVSRVITTRDGGAVSATTGNNINIFTVTRQPTAADVANGLFVVALENIASGASGRCRLTGYVEAKVAADVAANAETIFKGTADANFTLTAATPVTGATGAVKVIAYSSNGLAVTAATGLCWVWFNGNEGLTASAT
jgi:hypothetical protein